MIVSVQTSAMGTACSDYKGNGNDSSLESFMSPELARLLRHPSSHSFSR